MSYIHEYRVRRNARSPDVLEIFSAMPIYEYQPGFDCDRLPLLIKEVECLLIRKEIKTAVILPMDV